MRTHQRHVGSGFAWWALNRLRRLPNLDELILAKLVASLLTVLDCGPVVLLLIDSLIGGVLISGDCGGAASATGYPKRILTLKRPLSTW